MAIEVTVRDTETGESETAFIPAGGYVVTCAEPAYVAAEQIHANGTRIVTVRRRPASDGGGPDLCPQGCGDFTEDAAGGPCSHCWAAIDGNEANG